MEKKVILKKVIRFLVKKSKPPEKIPAPPMTDSGHKVTLVSCFNSYENTDFSTLAVDDLYR